MKIIKKLNIVIFFLINAIGVNAMACENWVTIRDSQTTLIIAGVVVSWELFNGTVALTSIGSGSVPSGEAGNAKFPYFPSQPGYFVFELKTSHPGYKPSIVIVPQVCNTQFEDIYLTREGSPTFEYDINGDTFVDAVDSQLVTNCVLGLSSNSKCDVDRSGGVNAVDVQLVINAALGKF